MNFCKGSCFLVFILCQIYSYVCLVAAVYISSKQKNEKQQTHNQYTLMYLSELMQIIVPYLYNTLFLQQPTPTIYNYFMTFLFLLNPIHFFMTIYYTHIHQLQLPATFIQKIVWLVCQSIMNLNRILQKSIIKLITILKMKPSHKLPLVYSRSIPEQT